MPYQEQGTVEVLRCRPMLFGFIPLRKNYGMKDLVNEADNGADGVVGVSVDQVWKFWLFGYTTCHELHGTQIQFAGGSVRAEAGFGGFQSTSTGAAASGLNSIVPESTYQTTNLIYSRIGREKPASDAEYMRDVQAVSAHIQRGASPPDLLVAAARGAEQLGSSASIEEILAAGLSNAP